MPPPLEQGEKQIALKQKNCNTNMAEITEGPYLSGNKTEPDEIMEGDDEDLQSAGHNLTTASRFTNQVGCYVMSNLGH